MLQQAFCRINAIGVEHRPSYIGISFALFDGQEYFTIVHFMCEIGLRLAQMTSGCGRQTQAPSSDRAK